MRQNRFDILGLLILIFLGCGFLQLGEREDRIQKTFAVPSEGRLTLNLDRGSVRVQSVETNAVTIQVVRRMKSMSKAKAKDLFKHHVVTFSQRGSDVDVIARFQGALSPSWNKRAHEMGVSYYITVPKKYHVDLKTKDGGSIDIQDGEANIEAPPAEAKKENH